MKRYTDTEIQKVRELRKKNLFSYIQLQRITGIPQTTIRNWCYSDNVHTKWDTLIATNKRRRIEYKKSEIHSLSYLNNISSEVAKILTALLYWCEGAKYPATNRLNFANSDIELVKTFLFLLRKGFILDESKFSVHLQIHDIQDYDILKKYWCKELNIPISQCIRPTITRANGKKHRSSYLGTCNLSYQDFRLQLKLIGLYEEFVNKFGLSAKAI